jgi:hypothetical protein
MEKLTDKELKLLRELEAKQKRIKRADAKFLKEADARKDELLSRWGIPYEIKQASPSADERLENESEVYPDYLREAF